MFRLRLHALLAALILCLSSVALASAAPPKGKHGRATPAQKAARTRAQRLGLGNLRAAGTLLAGRAEPGWVKAAGSGTPGILRYPVAKGWFVRGFGSGAGRYHQAIDIGGEVGWDVRAAAAGIVAYAGNQVSGYGNLVILVHPGGFITTYAHNSRNRVVPGQLVRRGQVIAELGSTGKSRGPHVHFELLFDGKNCDPAPLFRPGAKRKNGKPVPTSRAVWRKPHKRPKAIACYPRKHHPQRNPKLDLDEPDEPDEGAHPPARQRRR